MRCQLQRGSRQEPMPLRSRSAGSTPRYDGTLPDEPSLRCSIACNPRLDDKTSRTSRHCTHLTLIPHPHHARLLNLIRARVEGSAHGPRFLGLSHPLSDANSSSPPLSPHYMPHRPPYLRGSAQAVRLPGAGRIRHRSHAPARRCVVPHF